MLRIDKDGLIKEYLNNFFIELNFALDNWEKDIEKFSFGKNDFIPEIKAETDLKKAKDYIVAYFKVNTAALVDAYGTGSLMLENENPLYNEYRNSKEWNPERKGKTIVGRRAGIYKDIFGNPHLTHGKFVGTNIEGKVFYSRDRKREVSIEPIPPSNSIKIANYFLKKNGGTIDKAIKNAIKKTKMYNHIKEVN